MNRRHFLVGLAATTILAPLARAVPSALARSAPPALPPAVSPGPRLFAGADPPWPPGETWFMDPPPRQLGEMYGQRLHDLMARSLIMDQTRPYEGAIGVPIIGRDEAIGPYGYVSYRVTFDSRIVNPPPREELLRRAYLWDDVPPAPAPEPWKGPGLFVPTRSLS